MTQQMTLKQIAEAHNVSKRTAQRWFDRAKEQLGEFGETVGQTLVFTEAEANNIVTYGTATTVVAKSVTPVVTIVDEPTTPPTTTSDIVPVSPDATDDKANTSVMGIIPTEFNLGAITGELAPICDPLTAADQALVVMDSLMNALDQKDQALEQQQQATRQKRQQLQDKAQQLETKVNNHKLRQEFNQKLQQQDIEAAQDAVKKLQDLAGGG